MNNRNRKQDIIALKWMFCISKGYLKKVVVYAVLSAVLSFVGVMTAFGTKDIVNGAVGQDLQLLTKGAIILIGILAIQVIFKVISRNIYERTKAKIEIKIKSHIFGTLLKKDYSKVSAFHSGEILNRLTSDVNLVTDGVMNILPRIISLFTRLIVAVVVMTTFDPFFALAFIVVGVVLVILSRLFRGYLKSMHKKSQETDGKTRSFFQETVSEILVIKVFNAYHQILDKAHRLMNKNYDIRIKRATVSIFANSGIQLIFSLGHLFAIIWGGYRVYQGAIDVGEMSAVLQLVNQIQSPISSLSGILPSLYSTIASAERLIEFEELPDEITSGQAIDDADEFYNSFNSIRFDNVTFSYGRDNVLDCACGEIEKGDFVAVTGISGIGKSTMFKMMMGVTIPQSGEVYIVSENGSRFADSETRKLFAYVPQGNLLLSGTIYENITFMNENKSNEEIAQAIKISCCDSFINELPQGLDTVIGERGMGLSEGQAQRIAIARAILYGAPILLLDEATSALDEETEKQLIQNLKDLKNKTLLIITHKKAALSVCNKELQIIDGKIHTKEPDCNYEN